MRLFPTFLSAISSEKLSTEVLRRLKEERQCPDRELGLLPNRYSTNFFKIAPLRVRVLIVLSIAHARESTVP